MEGRQLSEYDLPQQHTMDNNRFARKYRGEISNDRDERQAYV